MKNISEWKDSRSKIGSINIGDTVIIEHLAENKTIDKTFLPDIEIDIAYNLLNYSKYLQELENDINEKASISLFETESELINNKRFAIKQQGTVKGFAKDENNNNIIGVILDKKDIAGNEVIIFAPIDKATKAE